MFENIRRSFDLGLIDEKDLMNLYSTYSNHKGIKHRFDVYAYASGKEREVHPSNLRLMKALGIIRGEEILPKIKVLSYPNCGLPELEELYKKYKPNFTGDYSIRLSNLLPRSTLKLMVYIFHFKAFIPLDLFKVCGECKDYWNNLSLLRSINLLDYDAMDREWNMDPCHIKNEHVYEEILNG